MLGENGGGKSGGRGGGEGGGGEMVRKGWWVTGWLGPLFGMLKLDAVMIWTSALGGVWV